MASTNDTHTPQLLHHLSDIAHRYDVIFSDIWGVLHDGVEVYPAARNALETAHKAGKAIILITNSPRPSDKVIEQIAALGLPRAAYDGIVTSGDVTRALIADAPKKLFHIGPKRDLPLFDGLGAELVDEAQAQAVACTGLFHEDSEDPENYRPLLQRLRARNLPFICANPDIIVHIGRQQLWCAGALARIYTELGGKTLIAGKPHHPIYEQAFILAAKKLGLSSPAGINKNRVLVIGDGLGTDIKGAENQKLDALFIAGGIHINDYSDNGGINPDKLAAFLKTENVSARYFMPELA